MFAHATEADGVLNRLRESALLDDMRVVIVLVTALALTPVAAAATVSHGMAPYTFIAEYTAAPGEINRLSIIEDGNWVVFRDAGASISAQGNCVAVAANEARCPRSFLLLVRLGDGDDEAAVVGMPAGSASLPFRFDSAPALQFVDDAGNDRYMGGPGREAFLAASTADGSDVFVGGEGQDEVQYVLRVRRTFVSLDGDANDGEPREADNIGTDVEDAYAGPGGMTFVGSSSRNRFWGYPWSQPSAAGKDRAWGGAGNDRMEGGFGDDRLDGGSGNDEIHGRNGRDRLLGGKGGDSIRGGVGADVLFGGGGRDFLRGMTNADLYCTRDGRRDRIYDGGRSIDRAYVDRLDIANVVEFVSTRACPR